MMMLHLTMMMTMMMTMEAILYVRHVMEMQSVCIATETVHFLEIPELVNIVMEMAYVTIVTVKAILSFKGCYIRIKGLIYK
jgi:hypothetical protein